MCTRCTEELGGQPWATCLTPLHPGGVVRVEMMREADSVEAEREQHLTRDAHVARMVGRGVAARALLQRAQLARAPPPLVVVAAAATRQQLGVHKGEQVVAVDTPWGRMGLSICYDMRFPDLYRALTDAGATILLAPAAFTVPTGQAHWHVLLRARAIEAGCVVIATAQAGAHADGRVTYGHSLVVDPWGDLLLDMGDTAGLGLADIDLSRIGDVRARVPALANRRTMPRDVTIS